VKSEHEVLEHSSKIETQAIRLNHKRKRSSDQNSTRSFGVAVEGWRHTSPLTLMRIENSMRANTSDATG
jgi:hypothetical protein